MSGDQSEASRYRPLRVRRDVKRPIRGQPLQTVPSQAWSASDWWTDISISPPGSARLLHNYEYNVSARGKWWSPIAVVESAGVFYY